MRSFIQYDRPRREASERSDPRHYRSLNGGPAPRAWPVHGHLPSLLRRLSAPPFDIAHGPKSTVIRVAGRTLRCAGTRNRRARRPAGLSGALRDPGIAHWSVPAGDDDMLSLMLVSL